MKFDVAYTIDKNYQIPFCCSLTSLLETNNELVKDVYVIQNQKSSDTPVMKQIRKFIKSDYGREIIDVVIDHSDYSKFRFSGHVSTVAYYIFSIADYLPQNASRVLYLDPDTIITSKLSLLEDLQFGECDFLFAIDHGKLSFERLKKYCPDILNYFNGGVLFLNLPFWREKDISKDFWQYANNRPDDLKFWNQDILNIVLHNKWNELPYSYNAYDIIQKISYTPHIIHYTGNRKPWNYFCDHPYKGFYWEVLKKTPFNRFFGIKRLLGNIITPLLLPIANLKNKFHSTPFTFISKGEN